MNLIVIDGECQAVKEIHQYGYLPMVELENGEEYYLAVSSEEAGEAARKYWEELAEEDPREFAALVGEETLVAWGMHQYAGPGSTKVKDLEEWLDLWLNTPEEQWGSYDGTECDCSINRNLAEEMNAFDEWQNVKFKGVCYRHN